MKIIITTIILLFSLPIFAENKDYEYCIVWGVAGGADDKFIQNLTDKVLQKKGISQFDKVCSTLKQTSYKQGKQFSQGNTSDKEAAESWAIYQNFRNKVMNNLVELLKL